MSNKNNRLLKVLGLMLLMTVAYAANSSANGSGYYNCCGNEQSKLTDACRYTNRDTTCEYDADCKGDTYGECCQNGCWNIEM